MPAEMFELSVQNLQHLERMYRLGHPDAYKEQPERGQSTTTSSTSDTEPDAIFHPDCLMVQPQRHTEHMTADSTLDNPHHTQNQHYNAAGEHDSQCHSEVSSCLGGSSDISYDDDKDMEAPIYPPDLEYGLVHTEVIHLTNDKIVWETHHIAVERVPGLGFGIAVSGGKDNPHFSSGETSIAISDVLKGGPADGLLKLKDRVVSINGISMEEANHSEAISSLRESGNMVDLLIKRKVYIPSPHKKQEKTITFDKLNKDQELGLEVGCKLYVKSLKPGSMSALTGEIEEGDFIVKINKQDTENLSVSQTQRLLERAKGKLSLMVERSPKPINSSAASSQGYGSNEDIYQWTLQHQQTGSGYKSPTSASYTSSQKTRSRRLSRLLESEENARYVTYKKENGSTGLTIAGGNLTGVYISDVQGGGPAQKEGIRKGDYIVQINGIPVRGLTRDQVIHRLDSLPETVNLLLIERLEQYSALFTNSKNDSGDEFYIRANIRYNPGMSNSKQNLLNTGTDNSKLKSLSITPGEIFKVIDTSPMVGKAYWMAVRIDGMGEEVEHGIIPNKSAAEKIFNSKVNNEQTGRTRVKSLNGGREGWQSVVLGSSSDLSKPQVPDVYEKVTFEEANFHRPVALFGALSELCREKLLSTHPDQFEAPQVCRMRSGYNTKNILKLESIEDIEDRGKHCLLDLPPHAIEQLLTSHHHPIVIHVSSDKANIRDSKIFGSLKRLDQLSEKIETNYPHLISAKINITRGHNWLQQVCDAITSEQEKAVWISENIHTRSQTPSQSGYLSLSSSRLSNYGSRGDLSRHQYNSQPCLAVSRGNCNSMANSPLPPSRARSATDPNRHLPGAQLHNTFGTSANSRVEHLSGRSKHSEMKNNVKIAYRHSPDNFATYENSAYIADEHEDCPVEDTDILRNLRRGRSYSQPTSDIWFTEGSSASLYKPGNDKNDYTRRPRSNTTGL